VTTEKDAVRLRAEPTVAAAIESAGPLYTLGIAVRVTHGDEELEAALVRQLRISGSGSTA
jgi:hypothetical protein